MISELLKVPANYHLPFHITGNGFLEWFENQQKHIEFDNAITLYYALKTLNSKLVKLETRLIMLHKIGLILPRIADYLLNEFIEKSFPLRDKAADCAILISGFYSEVSNGYHLIINSKEFLHNSQFNPQLKIKIIYQGLDALNNEILSFSLSYCPVTPGFWQKTYDLFQLANNLGLAQTKIDLQGNTVENVFKSILAFYLSNPGQFNPDELLIIAKLINHYSKFNNLMKQLPDTKFKGLPAVILSGDRPPEYADLSQAYEKSILYVATANLAMQLLEYLTKKSKSSTADTVNLSRTTTQRLVRSLTLNTRRKFEREAADIYCAVIVGLYEVFKFLSTKKLASKVGFQQPVQNYLDNVHSVFIKDNLKTRDGVFIKDSLKTREDVVPSINYDFVGHGSQVGLVDPDGLNFGDSVHYPFKNKIVDSSKIGFGVVLSEPTIRLRNMDFIGIFDKDFVLLGIGTIRRISFVNALLKIGIELLATEVVCIYASTILIDEENITEGILFANKNDPGISEVMILPKIEFMVNDKIFIEKNKEGRKCYKVLCIINKTKSYLHLQLAKEGY